MTAAIPKDYIRFQEGDAHVIAHQSCVDWAKSVLPEQTLYTWAANQSDARDLGGRVSAYSVLLPGQDRRVVIRHSHHGGPCRDGPRYRRKHRVRRHSGDGYRV